tara:strand:+ start:1814 stop:2578 length:765 start_codon:yes stop_codon:yes gene_type:complete
VTERLLNGFEQMKLIAFLLTLLLLLPALAKPPEKLFTTVLGKPIIVDDDKTASRKVFTILLDNYAKKNSLTPTSEELNQYDKFITLGRELVHRELELELEKLIVTEAARPLSDIELKKKNTTNSVLSTFSERQLVRSNNNDQIKLSKENNDIKKTIQRWKVNKSLYEKYGGGIVFQQAGLEPSDAWLQFFENEVLIGNLFFHDSSFEAQFWEIITPDKEHWSYNAQPQKPFDKPFWVSGLTILEKKIQQLKLSE